METKEVNWCDFLKNQFDNKPEIEKGKVEFWSYLLQFPRKVRKALKENHRDKMLILLSGCCLHGEIRELVFCDDVGVFGFGVMVLESVFL